VFVRDKKNSKRSAFLRTRRKTRSTINKVEKGRLITSDSSGNNIEIDFAYNWTKQAVQSRQLEKKLE